MGNVRVPLLSLMIILICRPLPSPMVAKTAIAMPEAISSKAITTITSKPSIAEPMSQSVTSKTSQSVTSKTAVPSKSAKTSHKSRPVWPNIRVKIATYFSFSPLLQFVRLLLRILVGSLNCQGLGTSLSLPIVMTMVSTMMPTMMTTMVTSSVTPIVTAEMAQAGAIMSAIVMMATIVMPSKMSPTIMSLLVTKAMPANMDIFTEVFILITEIITKITTVIKIMIMGITCWLLLRIQRSQAEAALRSGQGW